MKVTEKIEHLQSLDEGVSQYLKISSKTKKHVVSIFFHFDKPGDYYGELHMKMSHEDIVRIPIYVKVNSDIIKFTPSILDFGIVA